ncbi:hypothetical protein [Cellulomonas olei]|uniref:hypothetical protein n=1 Tax=Cellulomonas sp. P4 TaxID=3142533 RepID=UPI0031BB09A5
MVFLFLACLALGLVVGFARRRRSVRRGGQAVVVESSAPLPSRLRDPETGELL